MIALIMNVEIDGEFNETDATACILPLNTGAINTLKGYVELAGQFKFNSPVRDIEFYSLVDWIEKGQLDDLEIWCEDMQVVDLDIDPSTLKLARIDCSVCRVWTSGEICFSGWGKYSSHHHYTGSFTVDWLLDEIEKLKEE